MMERKVEMEKETYRGCPFCGQAVMGEGNPEEICTCDDAVRYQKIIRTIDAYCGTKCPRLSKEFRMCTENQIAGLRGLASFICAEEYMSASVSLPDGSTVKIGSKVSRAVNVKREEKVE